MTRIVYKFDIEARHSEPGILFHATKAAKRILDDGEIKLNLTDVVSRERDASGVYDYPYFLSTARSISNRYFSKGMFRQGMTILILDKDKIKRLRGVKVVPVDYFQQEDETLKESEERVMSHEPTLPLSIVKSIVVILQPVDPTFLANPKEMLKAYARLTYDLLYYADRKKIPVEIYRTMSDYIRKDSKTMTRDEVKELAKGYIPSNTDEEKIPQIDDLLEKFSTMLDAVERNEGIDNISKFDDREALDFAMQILMEDDTMSKRDKLSYQLMAVLVYNSSPGSLYYDEALKFVKFFRRKKIKIVTDHEGEFYPVQEYMFNSLAMIKGFIPLFTEYTKNHSNNKQDG